VTKHVPPKTINVSFGGPRSVVAEIKKENINEHRS